VGAARAMDPVMAELAADLEHARVFKVDVTQ
jgi:hypothetical protein